MREGHGNLRAEHVLVDGAIRVVDCVEFDADLRRSDVGDDLTFLVADLAAATESVRAAFWLMPPGRPGEIPAMTH